MAFSRCLPTLPSLQGLWGGLHMHRMHTLGAPLPDHHPSHLLHQNPLPHRHLSHLFHRHQTLPRLHWPHPRLRQNLLHRNHHLLHQNLLPQGHPHLRQNHLPQGHPLHRQNLLPREHPLLQDLLHRCLLLILPHLLIRLWQMVIVVQH